MNSSGMAVSNMPLIYLPGIVMLKILADIKKLSWVKIFSQGILSLIQYERLVIFCKSLTLSQVRPRGESLFRNVRKSLSEISF